MRTVLIIFAVFAAAPLLIALMVAIPAITNSPSLSDALFPMPIFLLGAAAVSAFIMACGVVVALVLRLLERRRR